MTVVHIWQLKYVEVSGWRQRLTKYTNKQHMPHSNIPLKKYQSHTNYHCYLA